MARTIQRRVRITFKGNRKTRTVRIRKQVVRTSKKKKK
jgi:hypothetical protein